jgi:hypothetical protein
VDQLTRSRQRQHLHDEGHVERQLLLWRAGGGQGRESESGELSATNGKGSHWRQSGSYSCAKLKGRRPEKDRTAAKHFSLLTQENADLVSRPDQELWPCARDSVILPGQLAAGICHSEQYDVAGKTDLSVLRLGGKALF